MTAAKEWADADDRQRAMVIDELRWAASKSDAYATILTDRELRDERQRHANLTRSAIAVLEEASKGGGR